MSKRLQVPDALQHLIEKRESTERRRKARRATSTASDAQVSGKERRKTADRRKSNRRRDA